jgi:hypothetical protein
MASNRDTWKQLRDKFGETDTDKSKTDNQRGLAPDAATGKWFGTGADAVWIGPGLQASRTTTQPTLSADSPAFTPALTLEAFAAKFKQHQPKRKKKKTRPLTNKERQQSARQYWEDKHAPHQHKYLHDNV